VQERDVFRRNGSGTPKLNTPPPKICDGNSKVRSS